MLKELAIFLKLNLLKNNLHKSWQISAKFAALLMAGVLLCVACEPRNSVDSPADTEKPKPNQHPKVFSVTADPASVAAGQRSTITVAAADPDNDELSYSYEATGGTISGSGKSVTFHAGSTGGIGLRDGGGQRWPRRNWRRICCDHHPLTWRRIFIKADQERLLIRFLFLGHPGFPADSA
jgi:hypothetical protein